MKFLSKPALLLCLAAAATAANAQAPFTDPNPGETDRQTIKRILVDNPGGTFVDPNPGEGISATLKRILLKPAPSNGSDRGEIYAHLYAAGGDGSEGSPFVSADGSGGIGAALAALSARGGCITLAARRFDVTSAPAISTPGTCLRGLSTGANIDPNGESEGVSGTKIHTTAAGVIIAAPTSGARLGGISIESIYFWGPGKNSYNTRTAAISVTSASLDQPHFRDINAGNCTAAIQIDPTPGTGQFDTPYLTRVNALHCCYGILISGGGSIFGHVTDCCFADLDSCGIFLNVSGGYNCFTGIILARCAGVESSSIVLNSPGNIVAQCHIELSGQRQLTAGHNAAADGVQFNASDNSIQGGLVETTLYGSGVHIGNGAARCKVLGVSFAGNATDITVDSGCADTVIDCPGQVLSITDNGTRTIIDGQAKNSGDPDTAGDWNGHAKPAGLQIIDTATGDVWLYGPALSGGRKKI